MRNFIEKGAVVEATKSLARLQINNGFVKDARIKLRNLKLTPEDLIALGQKWQEDRPSLAGYHPSLICYELAEEQGSKEAMKLCGKFYESKLRFGRDYENISRLKTKDIEDIEKIIALYKKSGISSEELERIFKSFYRTGYFSTFFNAYMKSPCPEGSDNQQELGKFIIEMLKNKELTSESWLEVFLRCCKEANRPDVLVDLTKMYVEAGNLHKVHRCFEQIELQEDHKKSHGKACVKKGIELDKEGNSDKALEWYHEGAINGDREAMILYGEACVKRGIKLDKEGNNNMALQLYHDGALHGNKEAMILYGECLRGGIGIKKDQVKAEKWYKKADLSPYPEGKYRMKKLDET